MFRTIRDTIPRDNDYDQRVHDLTVNLRILEGTFYDNLPNEYWQNQNDDGSPVPVSSRRPSVRYNLARLVAGDAVSMLFGDGRFPAIDCRDQPTRDALAAVVKESRLVATMLEAGLYGSVGSTAVLMRVLKGRIFFERMDTTFLTPAWDREAPDTLAGVQQLYKVRGSILQAQGYSIPPKKRGENFWFMRVWGPQAETWFIPWTKEEEAKDGFVPVVDKDRTVQHGLGFVPLVWIKNLPGGNGIDGACTFSQAIDTAIEIDYQLSQGGRGLKYSSDPELMLRAPAMGTDGQILKGSGNAIVVSEKGDAKWLEINGHAVSAVLEYVRTLRELALESVRGNRSNADKQSSAQSGRAMELLYQPLIWLVGELRVSYGEDGLLRLMQMVVKASQVVAIEVGGEPLGKLSNDPLTLKWSAWFHLAPQDKLEQAQALAVAKGAGVISAETAVKDMASVYDVEDQAAELARISADRDDADARALKVQAQVKATETLPA